MILFAAIFLLCIGIFFGEVITEVLHIKKVRHKSIYGVFFYMLCFFIFSGISIVLNVSWNIYFIFVSTYSAVVLLYSFYYCFIKKSWRPTKKSIKKMVQYIFSNWHVIILLLLFSILLVQSNSMNYRILSFYQADAASDNHVYLAMASKLINADHLNFTKIEMTTGESSFVMLNFIMYWEMFWAFLSEAFQIKLLTLVQSYFVPFIFLYFFLLYDEFIFNISKTKQFTYTKYALFTFAFMYIFNGMQLEYSKFMFFPWFGNNFTTLLTIPIVTIFLLQAITNKRMWFPMYLVFFLLVGFSPGAFIFAGLLMPVCTYIFIREKKYEIRRQWFIVLCASLMSLLFLSILHVQVSTTSGTVYGLAMFRYNDITGIAEKGYFDVAIKERLLFILPGILLFLVKVKENRASLIEKTLINYGMFLLLLAITPGIGNAIFVLFGYSLRRFYDGLMFAFIIYSMKELIILLYNKNIIILFSRIALMCAICLFFTKSFIVSNMQYFYGATYPTPARVSDATNDLYEYLLGDEKYRAICVYPTESFVEIDFAVNPVLDTGIDGDKIYMTLYYAITADVESYISKCVTDDHDFNYLLVTNEITQKELEEQFGEVVLEKHFDSKDLSFSLYKKL